MAAASGQVQRLVRRQAYKPSQPRQGSSQWIGHVRILTADVFPLAAHALERGSCIQPRIQVQGKLTEPGGTCGEVGSEALAEYFQGYASRFHKGTRSIS
jgi:hypothetical protein